MINTKYPDKPALITKDQTVTYRTLIGNINKFAGLFAGKGYQKIALFSENSPEWIYAFYAAWQNNATVVTIDFLSSADDAAYIVNDCRPELIFASLGSKKTWDKMSGKLDYLPDIIFFENIPGDEPPSDLSWKMPADLEKTAVIIYTSGTTGSPKGVMLTFANLLANIKAVSEDVKIFNADRDVLMLLPLHAIIRHHGNIEKQPGQDHDRGPQVI